MSKPTRLLRKQLNRTAALRANNQGGSAPGRRDLLSASGECRNKTSENIVMLELRPTCENCNAALPPNSNDAMICSFECTFCRSCVENILHNVCPNCGGGFCPRPIRPKRDWKDGNYLGAFPASTTIKQ